MTTEAEVTPSLRALLAGSVDYAGLFPPATLALEPALDNYAAYVRSGDAWMLGYFVLPMLKLPETGRLLAGRFDSKHPLRISVLGATTRSADGFLNGLRMGLQALADFQDAHGAAVAIEQIEAPLPTDITPGHALGSLLWEAANLIAERPLRAFWEIPFSENLPDLLRGFAEHNTGDFYPHRHYHHYTTPRFGPNGRILPHSPVPHLTRCRPFGAKLRTGGVEAGMFPSSAQLAAALVAARDAGVALKFTAGLHHPLRRFDAGVAARMHGFVNVFAAGVLIRQRPLDTALTQAILEDENPASFRFDPEGFRWRGWRATTGAASEAREFITSFGSCSFDDPRDDLRAAGLIL